MRLFEKFICATQQIQISRQRRCGWGCSTTPCSPISRRRGAWWTSSSTFGNLYYRSGDGRSCFHSSAAGEHALPRSQCCFLSSPAAGARGPELRGTYGETRAGRAQATFAKGLEKRNEKHLMCAASTTPNQEASSAKRQRKRRLAMTRGTTRSASWTGTRRIRAESKVGLCFVWFVVLFCLRHCCPCLGSPFLQDIGHH